VNLGPLALIAVVIVFLFLLAVLVGWIDSHK
jgi:hypothetical protein